ncbi:Mss4-like protein [Microdochium bolleyi]|uniref:Mss4-like protein n=1 Tax=Microdochium bolleyi TaxID=196109 RepID=A0A136J2J0_9PEZI|nr:Mss4-like protein [Microdochium bolleyi]
MEARCQCGAVQFTVPTPKPLALYICHCASCRRQTSSAFGTSAIFPRFALPENDALACYTRPTSATHTLYCYFCRHCGTRLLHSTPSKNVVSVKGGCLEGLDWNSAIHIWTQSAMVPIPEGVERYDREEDDRRSSASSASGSGGSYASSQEFLDQPASGPHLAQQQHAHGLPTAVGPGLVTGAAAAAGAGVGVGVLSSSGTAMKEDGVKGLCELSGL